MVENVWQKKRSFSREFFSTHIVEGFIRKRVIFKRRLMDLLYPPQRGICTIAAGDRGKKQKKKKNRCKKQTNKKKLHTRTHRSGQFEVIAFVNVCKNAIIEQISLMSRALSSVDRYCLHKPNVQVRG